MKTFEEKYTAWVDGKLPGDELAAFEKELNAEAASDKTDALKLGSLLRAHHAPAPEMANADFFSHQLRERIEREAAKPVSGRPARFRWTLPRLAWMGASCLAVTAVMYATMIRHTLHGPPTESEYLATVLDTQSGDPAITATSFHSKENNVTVIWLNGLPYLPESYGL